MLRRTSLARKQFTWHYISPLVELPHEYAQRVTNKKEGVETDRRDPKNYWGLHNIERFQVHPSVWGYERHNYGGMENKGGIICDVPPVPVYRANIWCMGHFQAKFHHPRIHIKVPPGKTIGCKWCRVKYINMSTDEDNDEDWEDAYYRINTTPESEEDLKKPWRNLDGVLRKSNFLDGQEPHPKVYKSVFDPQRYAVKRKGHDDHHGHDEHHDHKACASAHEHHDGHKDAKGH